MFISHWCKAGWDQRVSVALQGGHVSSGQLAESAVGAAHTTAFTHLSCQGTRYITCLAAVSSMAQTNVRGEAQGAGWGLGKAPPDNEACWLVTG
jgi:hypothetical protein